MTSNRYENDRKRVLFSCLNIPFLVCIGGFIAAIATYTRISFLVLFTIENLSGINFNHDQFQMAAILIGIPIGGIAGAIFITVIGYFFKVTKWPEIVAYLIVGMMFGGLGGLIFGWNTLAFMVIVGS